MLLTEREKKILRLVIEGQKSSQIAKQLGIKVNTVKSYTTRVAGKYRKFGFRSLREVKDAFLNLEINQDDYH